MSQILDLHFGQTVLDFIRTTATGKAREIFCFGTRGDGKTIGALAAMIAHAEIHRQHGHPWPVSWMGVTDTFTSHRAKTLRSLENPLWLGLWRIEDGGHRAAFRNPDPIVELDLFGIEDQGAMDRVRRECVGVWFEEPAPSAVLVQSSGVSDTAWMIALTSQRIPSHAHPAIATLNYPDEDHWTWQRAMPGTAPINIHPEHPERMAYRIPPGERASAEQRTEWMTALKDRPDLMRRLLEGKPGTVLLGKQVAVGFDEDKHVAKGRILPVQGEPIFVGQDGGLTPTTVIGQTIRGAIFVYAAFSIDRGGMRQHYERNVVPWLAQNAPWALRNDSMFIRGTYDPAIPDDESDSDRNPVDVCAEMVGGYWEPGPVSWEARKGALITALNKHVGPGEPALKIDPVGGRPLIQTLSGRWYYPQNRLGDVSRDAPAKPNHPWEDLGDAFCYFLAGAMPELGRTRGPIKVETEFIPGEARDSFVSVGQVKVDSDFSV